MGSSTIIRQFLSKTGVLNDCEVYLSICVGYISIGEWDNAKYFLKCAIKLSHQYKYDIIIDELSRIIDDQNTIEAKLLMEGITTKVANT